jgi:hypothetical protein
MQFDTAWQMAYTSGQNNGMVLAAAKVKEAFNGLPATADNATKDLLLDLHNEIVKGSNGAQETQVSDLQQA